MPEAARADSPLALEVKGLTKRFPGVLALDDVSVAFRPGEIHALIGQNGAGKSTVINILSGMHQPDAGEVYIGGRSVAIESTRHAVECGLATVYQELSLLPNLSVAQNLALGREPRRFGLLDVGVAHRDAAAALERIGAGAIAPDRRVGSLSVAERQLVEIAKALSRDPGILILDEPTAPLARREADRLFAILDTLSAAGMTIIFVSHRFAEILQHCDRGTVLRNGRTVVTTELRGWSEADLTEAMIGARGEMFSRRRAQAGRKETAAPALAVEGLGWGHKVREVSFSAAAGEIVGITGLLGAGQNEIGRLIGGDLRPDTGAVLVRGRKVPPRGPAAAKRAGICLMTDDRKVEGILPNLPLRENAALPSLDRRRAGFLVRRSAERQEVAAALARFDVVARSPEAPIRTLSGGNQQKALLARWHLADSDIFVLIEPTRGVDVSARAEIYRRLEALAEAGKAILVISSDMPEVLALADRVLVVRDGRIAAEAEPGRLDEERLNLLVQGAA